MKLNKNNSSNVEKLHNNGGVSKTFNSNMFLKKEKKKFAKIPMQYLSESMQLFGNKKVESFPSKEFKVIKAKKFYNKQNQSSKNDAKCKHEPKTTKNELVIRLKTFLSYL